MNKINILKYTLLILINIIFLNSQIFSQSKNWTDYINLSDDVRFGDELYINTNQINKNEYGLYPKRYPIVYTKFNDKSILIWNDTKEKITEVEYDKIEEISYNTFIVKKNQLFGVIDSTGNIIIPIKYSGISCVDPKIIIYDINGFSDYKGSTDILGGIKPNINRVLENNFSNLLDNQLFSCSYIYEKSINGIYDYTEILNRNGKVLVRENNSSVELGYYRSKNQLFTIYYINHNQNPNPGYTTPPKFKIGKWGDSSFFKFDGEIEGMRTDTREFFNFITKKPLYTVIKKNNKLRFFDLESLKEITSVPPFDKLVSFLEKNEMFVTRTYIRDKYGNNDIYESIISKDFKVVLPFVPYYQFMEHEYDSSLIIFRSYEGEGIFKLGKDIIKPLKFKIISYIENNNKTLKSKFMFVVNNDFSKNIFDLTTFNLVFKKNYDKIVFNGREFECTFEGKTENIFLELN
jgi:hypothetical protein